ncbi:radical SAM protein [uncultured Intestinimonas sp.]|uniref:radical SAM/SPASM domain-containing protein n=1 Tax=uncultured Intestinimonas sp. TaxID=1689265 RepID=UPI0025D101EB|nr:radical SAM protein [uncultured Intestinimonas sp.]
MIYNKRLELGEQIPLSGPFSLHIFPAFYCNFRCNYCLYSLSEEALAEKQFHRQMMDFSVYQKAIDDALQFVHKLKALIFAGHGEPLIHPRIADMVAYAEQKNAAERTEIVTNGSLLTPELSDALIAAGLKRLRVSIQGTDAGQYEKTCGVTVDFEKLVENLGYFYHHKRDTEVCIKIIDCALDGEDGEKKFRRIFSPIADITAIEYAIPFVKEIDYSNLNSLSGRCKQGNLRHSTICAMPFYMLVVYPDGQVCPCCSTDVPCFWGSVQDASLLDIWNSGTRKEFLKQQLDGVQGIPVCGQCSVPAFGLQDGDYLDPYVQQLKSKFQ